MKILANDGISALGINLLEKENFKVITTKVAQDQLIDFINEEKIDVILVRSATKVRKDIIDSCPSIKIIGRGGVGMDNIDVEYARSKGIKVINTPGASSVSVAELVISHLMCMVRFLSDSNRNMPLEGESNFAGLKKKYAKGIEVTGKTIGFIGFGKIGQEVAKKAIGMGMNVLYYTRTSKSTELTLNFFNGESKIFKLESSSLEDIITKSDFISVNTPSTDKPIISKKEFDKMKEGVGIINASRGGVISELDLINALDFGKVAYAGLDVFENEPTPNMKILMHPDISLTPHIGGATVDAQNKIGEELAEQIISILKK